ncbi:hypothetical protein J1605_015110 [Eschrichtius robustus]|uniref:RalBP1-associated Eps domain-containing protein 2 n=1 Tax=Eschrichtius robustus TaxID=9764 RepID=A0AB34GAN8_ESCRO|nr:hypothetical protein J1605_015110 [Eschrichtius robustus]
MWAHTCGPCGDRAGRSRAGSGLAVEGECGPQVQVLFISTGHGQPCTRCLSGPCSAMQKADIGLTHLGSEQGSEAELHPQLNRAPSQAAESSPTKKDVPYSQPPSKPIRRKFRPENQATENQEPTTAVGGPASVATMKPHPTVQKQSSKQKKAIQTAIRKNKEANAVLARLNSELQQQLKVSSFLDLDYQALCLLCFVLTNMG